MTTIPLAPQLEAFRDPKLRQFALWGAAGCLAGALVGQLLLAATRSRAVANRQAVCLLIDCSGSMGIDQPGQKLREVKDAAIAFVARHSTPADRIGVIGFGQTVHRAAGINDDPAKLQSAIRELYDGGTTAMDIGIQAAANQLGELPEDWRDGGVTRSILLFTDGEPDNGPSTLAAAQQCRSSGMRIVAIGTGDAQTDFLAQVTGDRKLVFNVAAGDFDEGFRKAEKAIYGGSLVEAGGARQGFLTSFFRTAAWGLLAACGMSLALVAGQNRYLHRVALNSREATVAAIGGATAGFCGAAAGQVLYSIAAATANLPLLGALAPVTMPIGRVVGW
ncbi:MAG TPA: vWA domain-containing protein, partial [Pirellulales bacterium]|nr:vWA domain-containing protein [Pirellulales bacterium]